MAQQISVDYNALSAIKNAKGHQIAPLPCMREEYYLRKDKVVPPLQNGTQVANLQRGRPSIHQVRKWPETHEPAFWNQLVVLAVFSFTIASCAASARIVNETPTGGTVLYSYYEEHDVLTSPGRKDALRLLKEKCPAGYSISREGQITQISQTVDRAWMGQVSRDGQTSREKRWAIQFACK